MHLYQQFIHDLDSGETKVSSTPLSEVEHFRPGRYLGSPSGTGHDIQVHFRRFSDSWPSSSLIYQALRSGGCGKHYATLVIRLASAVISTRFVPRNDDRRPSGESGHVRPFHQPQPTPFHLEVETFPAVEACLSLRLNRTKAGKNKGLIPRR